MTHGDERTNDSESLTTRKRIEVVITALTRNQVYRKVSWVRIPPLPPSKKPLLPTTTKEAFI